MVLCLVLAAMAGIIINLLDHHWNPEHFPRPFYRGSWEGFWWAFVTMATVGYGDRAPLSFHARLFSFFWALTGLTVCGLFTGTVSSNLTSFSLTTDVKLIGKGFYTKSYGNVVEVMKEGGKEGREGGEEGGRKGGKEEGKGGKGGRKGREG